MPALIVSAALALAATARSGVAAPTPAPAPCTAAALSLRTDAGDGDFNGMSHGGTQLIVRNTGASTCLLAGLPTLTMLDGAGKTLPTARKAPPGMHPGPVVVPVRLAPGEEAAAPLRWVSGEVYDHSQCFNPAAVRLRFGAKVMVEGALAGRVCAPADAMALIEQPPLQKRNAAPR